MVQNPLDVDCNLIKTYLSSKDVVDLEKYLHKHFKFVRFDPTTKLPYPFAVSQEVMGTLSLITDFLVINFDKSDEMKLLTRKVYWSLRNCNVANNFVQDMCANDQQLLFNTEKILILVSEQDDVLCVKIISEFLTNVIVGREVYAHQVWSIFKRAALSLFKLVQFSDCISAFLYNILSEHLVGECSEIYEHLLNYYSDESSFYIKELFIMFIQNEQFLNSFPNYSIENKLKVLTFLKRKDREAIHGYRFSKVNINCIVEEFLKKCDNLFKILDDNSKSNEVKEITFSLAVILAYSWVQNYKIVPIFPLTEKCVGVLKKFHILRKEGHLSCIPVGVADIDKISEDDPFYEFETNLVAVLGNLCYKNKVIQDELRELGFIPLALDCGTNCFDASNPCRKERTVFVIRNLISDNIENQEAVKLEYSKLRGYNTS